MPKFKGGLLLLANIVIILLSCYQKEYYFFLITLFFHELGHILMIKLLKRRINGIDITCFGCLINVNDDKINFFEDLLIYSGGIIVNFFLLFIPIIYKYSLILLLFNLLPIYPLDGYRIYEAILAYFLPYRLAIKVISVISMILMVLLYMLLIYHKSILLIVNLIALSVLNIMNYYSLEERFSKLCIERLLHPTELPKRYINRANDIKYMIYYYQSVVFTFNDKKMNENELLKLHYNTF